MKKYRKGNITLQLRVPVSFAVSIIGRLYGMGIFSRDEYLDKLDKISHLEAEKERQKSEKLSRLLEKSSKKGKFFH